MTSAAEVFVIAIARASQRARQRLRGMSSADRDDVLSTAILWCWKNRAAYDPSVSLDDWFVGAVRNAKRDWYRGEADKAENLSEKMAQSAVAPDDTLVALIAPEVAEQMSEKLSFQHRQVLNLMAEGYTRAEICARGFSRQQYRETREHVREFRRLTPEVAELRQPIGAAVTAMAPNYDEDDRQVVTIDFPPHEFQDCPPCHKCKWFDGLMPAGRRATRMQIVELDVRTAVENIEREKLRIAQRVVDGTINDGRR